MGRTLDEIGTDYADFAEITVLVVEDRQKKRIEILFAVVELLPFEQEASPLLVPGADERFRCAKEPWNKDTTSLYAARARVSLSEALEFFRGRDGVRSLRLFDQGPARVLHQLLELHAEPPNEVPALITDETTSLYSVLPTRAVGVRVCSLFGDGNGQKGRFSKSEEDVLRSFGNKTLGVDLIDRAEHLGAIHLMLPNPWLRGHFADLDEGEQHMLLGFYERKGKSIVDGGTIQLTDHRQSGIGFDRVLPITSTRMVVPIGCEPLMLETRVRDRYGEVIEHSNLSFQRQFSTRINLLSQPRKVHPPDRNPGLGIELVPVRTLAEESVTRLRPEAPASQTLLAAAERSRNERRAAEQRGFSFFLGGQDSRVAARRVVRALVRTAEHRVLVCDPYLCADDVTEYATFTEVAGLEVQLLAAAQTLGELSNPTDKSGPTNGQLLQQRIQQLERADRTLRFACKVLRNIKKKSPIHDRFLVVDEHVYVLGSSLNEFGSRATTLYRVPNPRLVLDMLNPSFSQSPTLSDYLNKPADRADDE